MTATTEYPLFTGAEQHGIARGAAFSKSRLSDFLESSRNRTAPETDSGEKHQGKLKPPHSRTEPKNRRGKGNFQNQRANKIEKFNSSIQSGLYFFTQP